MFEKKLPKNYVLFTYGTHLMHILYIYIYFKPPKATKLGNTGWDIVITILRRPPLKGGKWKQGAASGRARHSRGVRPAYLTPALRSAAALSFIEIVKH